MRWRLATVTTSMLLRSASAAALTSVDQLPACWQTCIEKRGPRCVSTDLNCLCRFAATHASLPVLLTCVRKTCATEYFPEFLTASLHVMKTACDGTQHPISNAAVSKADGAAESAYSAIVVPGGKRGGSTTRTRATESRRVEATATALAAPGSVSASTTGVRIISSTTTFTPASRSAASVKSTTGVTTVSVPVATSSASSALSKSTSTSSAHESSGSGGTPLDVGHQGAGVKMQTGSLLGLAAAFVFELMF